MEIICAFRPSNDGKSGAKMMDWEHGWRLNAIRKSSLSTFGNLVSKSLWKSRLPGMHIIRMTSSWSPGWEIFYEQCDVSPSTNTSWIPSDFPLLHKAFSFSHVWNWRAQFEIRFHCLSCYALRIQRSCFRRCQCQWLAQEWEGILIRSEATDPQPQICHIFRLLCAALLVCGSEFESFFPKSWMVWC